MFLLLVSPIYLRWSIPGGVHYFVDIVHILELCKCVINNTIDSGRLWTHIFERVNRRIVKPREVWLMLIKQNIWIRYPHLLSSAISCNGEEIGRRGKDDNDLRNWTNCNRGFRSCGGNLLATMSFSFCSDSKASLNVNPDFPVVSHCQDLCW